VWSYTLSWSFGQCRGTLCHASVQGAGVGRQTLIRGRVVGVDLHCVMVPLCQGAIIGEKVDDVMVLL
jgi:hypothetical protein